VKQFSETDFTEDPRRFVVPTPAAHGDDDQIVPIVSAASKTAQLVKDATPKVYSSGADRGLPMLRPTSCVRYGSRRAAIIRTRGLPSCRRPNSGRA
jgi:hypothetical protein